MKKLISTAIVIVWSLTCYSVFGQSLVFNYIAPVPNSEYINPEQSIILKTGDPFDQNSIDLCEIIITGSESGIHEFSWKLSEDRKTLVIIPDNSFLYGETVYVKIANGLTTQDKLAIFNTDFHFKIKMQDNLPLLKEYYLKEHLKEISLSNSINSKKPLNITDGDYKTPVDYPGPEMINYEETDDDYLFFTLNPRAGAPEFNNYISINDKFGVPIFFRKTETNCMNFHVMPDGKLAYAWNDYGNPENEKYYFMDSSYVVIDSVKTGNGYNMDGHDMLWMGNGHYLLMSYDPQPVDMSQVVLGGNPNATVIGLVIQEVDTYGTVYFQWRSWDHFLITDATDDINLLAASIDYVHGNAFAFDLDGNLLISSRHLDEITKINYETGDIIYRFGLLSKNNQFVINNDPIGFSHQHDIRVLQNGNITLFDNGNLRPSQFSQALEYSINEVTMTANRVWQYQTEPTVYGQATGSYRRSANGKNLIGWGTTWPLAAIEVLTNNNKVFEVYLPNRVVSYRVLKHKWVTNLFTAPTSLHFGNFEGKTEAIVMVLPVKNNSEQLIRITSTSNHNEIFNVIDDLPLNIPAGETIELNISFLPQSVGAYGDRLTLNYDKLGLGTTERIARQISLHGIWNNSLPTITFSPEYGSVNIDRDTDITILFSRPIRKAGGNLIQNNDIPNIFSFNVSNIWGTDVTFTGTISEDRKQIIISPTEPLDEIEQYFVELKASTIEDDDGMIIDCPEATVFTTGFAVVMNPSKASSRVNIFPSPFVDRLLITSNNQNIGNIRIYNNSGNEIINLNCNEKEISIDTQNIPQGIYFIKISNNVTKAEITKIVKVR
ncbi:MAG: aryl-sulfate sulfotransferase [Bacteroidota bacterium]